MNGYRDDLRFFVASNSRGGVALSIFNFGCATGELTLNPVRQCLRIEVTHFDPP
jgi:hypothetical protein